MKKKKKKYSQYPKGYFFFTCWMFKMNPKSCWNKITLWITALKLNGGTLTSSSFLYWAQQAQMRRTAGKKLSYEAPEKVRGSTRKRSPRESWLLLLYPPHSPSNTTSPSNPPDAPFLFKSHQAKGTNAGSSHSPACDRLYDTTLHRLYTGLSAPIGASARIGLNSYPCELSLEVNLYWAEPEVSQHAEWELNELGETGRFFTVTLNILRAFYE